MVTIIEKPQEPVQIIVCPRCRAKLQFSKQDVEYGYIHPLMQIEPVINCPNCYSKVGITRKNVNYENELKLIREGKLAGEPAYN